MSTWAANTYNWNTIPYAWDDQLFYPAASSLAFTGKIPVSTTGVKISPDNGTLTLSTTAPEVIKYFLTYVGSASLTLTGQDVTAMTGHIISPAAASLTGLSTGTIWSDDSSSWTTVSGNWDTGTLTPIVGVTYTFVIDSSGNLVFTPYDPEYPIERQPKFISPILIS